MGDHPCQSRGNGLPHVGSDESTTITILDGLRTVVGICAYCGKRIIAQEPNYFTVAAPTLPHHRRLPLGMWQCHVTGLDHSPAIVVHFGQTEDRTVCVECDANLSAYLFRDNLTGLESRIYLHTLVIEEEPV